MACDINLSASPTKQLIFSKLINKYHRSFYETFDNYIIIGDLNLEPSDTTLKHFLGSNGLHNLIKGHTCFKGKGSLIDRQKVFL